MGAGAIFLYAESVAVGSIRLAGYEGRNEDGAEVARIVEDCADQEKQGNRTRRKPERGLGINILVTTRSHCYCDSLPMHIIRVALLLAGWHQALLLYLLRYVIDLVAIPGLIITIYQHASN